MEWTPAANSLTATWRYPTRIGVQSRSREVLEISGATPRRRPWGPRSHRCRRQAHHVPHGAGVYRPGASTRAPADALEKLRSLRVHPGRGDGRHRGHDAHVRGGLPRSSSDSVARRHGVERASRSHGDMAPGHEVRRAAGLESVGDRLQHGHRPLLFHRVPTPDAHGRHRHPGLWHGVAHAGAVFLPVGGHLRL